MTTKTVKAKEEVVAEVKDEIKVTSTTKNSYETLYQITINGVEKPNVNSNPFGNCQNFSIKNFNYVIHYAKNKEKILDIIREIKEVCRCDKPYLVVDLGELYYNQVKDYLTFVVNTRYVNLTGSVMYMCIIDTRRKD